MATAQSAPTSGAATSASHFASASSSAFPSPASSVGQRSVAASDSGPTASASSGAGSPSASGHGPAVISFSSIVPTSVSVDPGNQRGTGGADPSVPVNSVTPTPTQKPASSGVPSSLPPPPPEPTSSDSTTPITAPPDPNLPASTSINEVPSNADPPALSSQVGADGRTSSGLTLPTRLAAHSGTRTESIFTTINGTPTTIVTEIPTSLNSPPGKLTSTQRTGVIVGSAISGGALILGLLCGAILYRRHRRRRLNLAHRMLPSPRRTRLEDEDDFDITGPSLMSQVYSDSTTIMRPRASGSGSIFHEGVWPPPGSRMEDPIRAAGSQVDLGSIVDSVMGSDAADHSREMTQFGFTHANGNGSQPQRGSVLSAYSYHPIHSRDPSTGSVGSQVGGPSPTMGTSRAVMFADSPSRSAKAREAMSGSYPVSSRSRLSNAIMPSDVEPPEDSRDRHDDRLSVASTYSLPSLHPRNGVGPMSPPGSPVPLLQRELRDSSMGDAAQEIPPQYHTIRRDTGSSDGGHRLGQAM